MMMKISPPLTAPREDWCQESATGHAPLPDQLSQSAAGSKEESFPLNMQAGSRAASAAAFTCCLKYDLKIRDTRPPFDQLLDM